MLRLWLALAVMTVAARSEAATYHLVTSISGGGFLVDSSTIKRNGRLVSYWILWVDRVPAPLTGEDITIENYQMQHVEVDCIRDRRRVPTLVSYDPDGKTSTASSDTPPWSDLVPGTVGETLSRVACDPKRNNGPIFVGDPPGIAHRLRALWDERAREDSEAAVSAANEAAQAAADAAKAAEPKP